MSTKITSPRAELAVLRAMTHKNRAIAGTIVGQVDESYFEAEESRELYGAMRRHLATTGETPSFKLLVEDPDLSTHARTFMRDSEPVVDTIEDAVRAVKILNKYRQTRGLYKLAAEIDAALESPRFDVDQMMERASNSVASIRSNRSARDSFVHFGTDNNSTELMKDTFFGSSEDLVIPTGIKPFDEQSGGFLRGGLVTIGASSGGGKSFVALQIAKNMAESGHRVLLVPLEMSKSEMTSRLAANISGLDVTRILQRKLATAEAETGHEKMRKWARRVKTRGGRFTIYKPTEDLTIDEIFATVNSYD